MLVKNIFILLFLSFFGSYLYGQNETITELESEIKELDSKRGRLLRKIENEKLKQIQKDLKKYGLPKLEKGEELIEHSAMSLVYDENHEQAKWVAHIITPDVIRGRERRTNDFRPDDQVKTGSAVETDYFKKYVKRDGTTMFYGYGYDRGHLAPSADFSWSRKALSESYYYSNMSPQDPEFNREKWADLENLIRGYMYNHPETQLYVVTGPVLEDNLPKIKKGTNQVSIPKKFFKVVIDLKNKEGIGFLMYNRKTYYPLSSHARTIDQIEELTGIDFFHALGDKLENELEKKYNLDLWIPKTSKGDVSPIHPSRLPKNYFNSAQAKIYQGKREDITVCGKVVSAKATSNGQLFLNIDKNFPNQIFTVVIFEKDYKKFPYDIIDKWEGEKICVKGRVVDYGGSPAMIINRKDRIREYED